MFWNFTSFWHTFNSPQVKWDFISSPKRSVYVLANKFPNIFKFKILGNWEISKKS